MKKLLLVCVASIAVTTVAPAQNLPKLSEFLTSCYRDRRSCETKINDYVRAADQQKVICLPEDVSVRDAARETLYWLRKDENTPAELMNAPYDDGLYKAILTLYPCKPVEPPPPEPPPAGQ